MKVILLSELKLVFREPFLLMQEPTEKPPPQGHCYSPTLVCKYKCTCSVLLATDSQQGSIADV